jgi:hypothetical protein
MNARTSSDAAVAVARGRASGMSLLYAARSPLHADCSVLHCSSDRPVAVSSLPIVH